MSSCKNIHEYLNKSMHDFGSSQGYAQGYAIRSTHVKQVIRVTAMNIRKF